MRAARQRGHERIGIDDAPRVRVEDQDAVLRGFEQAPVAPLGRPQCGVCVAPIRDVACDADDVVAIEPDVLDADLDGERRAVLSSVDPGHHDRLRAPRLFYVVRERREIERRVDVENRPGETLLSRPAEIGRTLFVDVEDTPRRGIDDREGVVGLIDERSKQGELLGLSGAFGDIAMDRQEADDLAVIIEDRTGGCSDVQQPAVLGLVDRLVRDDGLLADEPRPKLLVVAEIVRTRFQDARRVANRFGTREAVELLERRIDVRDRASPIRHEDRVAGVLDEDRERQSFRSRTFALSMFHPSTPSPRERATRV
ncbi:MAG: hypothetical protein ABJE66_21345 [Deltaproteobacteria bacterium]